MARLYPRQLQQTTDSAGERKLFEAFAHDLPDEWVVFHHIHRLSRVGDRLREGEADFILAHPEYGVLVVEVKGGRIRFAPESQTYRSTDRTGTIHGIGDPFEQASRNKYWLIDYLHGKADWPPGRVIIGHAVAFPDVVIDAAVLRPNAPREIILDQTSLLNTETRLIQILESWRGPNDAPPGHAGIQALERLLGQAGLIRNPLLAEQIQANEQSFVNLTEEQYDLLEGLAYNRRAIIHGCAGSGKTMLAVEKARRLAEDDGLRVLYTCFNEGLADFVGQELGYRQRFDVFSYYSLVRHFGPKAGIDVPEYRTLEVGQTFFEKNVPDLLLESVSQLGPQYDAIVLDEMQDFPIQWWDSLFFLLQDSAQGIFYAFSDPYQAIFPPPQTKGLARASADFVPYRLTVNCRNTRTIAALTASFYPDEHAPRAKGPDGEPVEVMLYRDSAHMLNLLRRCLHRLTQEEHVLPDQIAIVTPRRSMRTDTSLVGPPSELTGIKLGNFQLWGNLPLGPGQILTKSIYSFKGLERPVIIVPEVDNQIPPSHFEKLLYTIISRAKTHLIVLAHENTDARILDRLKAGCRR
jgi:Nuclease-related domain/UvrD-like helicase C-terminal domain